MTPRGIRNHNPGNIKTGDAWQGAQGADGHFVVFADAPHGIRAAAKILQTYQTRHHLDTVRKIISRWAPPDLAADKNPTEAYIASVAIWTDIDADAQIDVYDYDTAYSLLRAIFRFENGKPPAGKDDWYPPEVYEQGLRLAGVVKQKSLIDSRTATGVVAGGAGAAVVVASALSTVWPDNKELIDAILSLLGDYWVETLAIAIGTLGQARALWARIDDKLKGRL